MASTASSNAYTFLEVIAIVILVVSRRGFRSVGVARPKKEARGDSSTQIREMRDEQILDKNRLLNRQAINGDGSSLLRLEKLSFVSRITDRAVRAVYKLLKINQTLPLLSDLSLSRDYFHCVINLIAESYRGISRCIEYASRRTANAEPRKRSAADIIDFANRSKSRGSGLIRRADIERETENERASVL